MTPLDAQHDLDHGHLMDTNEAIDMSITYDDDDKPTPPAPGGAATTSISFSAVASVAHALTRTH